VSEQRIAAREKLSRLLQNQLQDLSTDVYDELKRRTDGRQGMSFSRQQLKHRRCHYHTLVLCRKHNHFSSNEGNARKYKARNKEQSQQPLSKRRMNVKNNGNMLLH